MARVISLANGQKMPAFGLGTWLSSKDEVKTALRTALDAGYRMIDTAYNYLNEDAIGEVLQEYFKAGKLKREDIFVTTKLGSIFTRPSEVKTSMDYSLSKLGLDYVDLYLYHFPITLKNTGDPNDVFPMKDGKLLFDDNVDFCEVWKVMEELVEEGKTKSIGISNFNSKQTEAICNIAKVKPVVNQVECHAHFPQFELEKFCRDKGIFIMAYAPIGSPGRAKSGLVAEDKTEEPLLQDETVVAIAKKYKKTPAQVLLRNLLQRDIIVIPKSVTPSRIVENIQVYDFDLAKEDMDSLNQLKKMRLFMADVWYPLAFCEMDKGEYRSAILEDAKPERINERLFVVYKDSTPPYATVK